MPMSKESSEIPMTKESVCKEIAGFNKKIINAISTTESAIFMNLSAASLVSNTLIIGTGLSSWLMIFPFKISPEISWILLEKTTFDRKLMSNT